MAGDPNLVSSGLSRIVTTGGVKLDLQIYRLEQEPKWVLEVVSETGTSTVWEAPFDTDQEAFEAFQLALEEEGAEASLDRGNVIEFPTRR